MLTRDFPLKIKALSSEGVLEGLGSPYNDPPDAYGDVINPGAFRQAIAQQGKGYPLLWAHKQDEPLGLACVEDSPSGLLVHGQLLMADPLVQRVHGHMVMGSIKGLSIGYLTPGPNKTEVRADGVRLLKEIHLVEISVVAVPAAPRAQITAVKSLSDIRHLLKQLRDDEVDADALGDLRQIDQELKRLLVNDPHQQAAATTEALRAFAQEFCQRAG